MSDTPRTDALADRFGDVDEASPYWEALDLATQIEREMNRLYGYLLECQDAQLHVLSKYEGDYERWNELADLQRKITNCLVSR